MDSREQRMTGVKGREEIVYAGSESAKVGGQAAAA